MQMGMRLNIGIGSSVGVGVGSATLPLVAVNTVSLLHFNGADTGTTFTDENEAYTWTPTGMTTSTTQKKFGTTSAKLLTASASRLLAGQSISLPSDFTVEMFLYITSNPADGQLLADGAGALAFDLGQSGFPQFYVNAGAGHFFGTNPTLITQNQWVHFALTRTGTQFDYWLDGVNVKSGAIVGTYAAFDGVLQIGDATGLGRIQCFNGYIDEFRISNIARYSEAFTPTIVPFVLD